MNIFYINIVYRKLSIRKCRAGEKCSHQEIENQQQLPNQYSDRVDDPVLAKSHNLSSGSSQENIEKSIMMPEINSNIKNESKTPTDGGLMIGALNLVSCMLNIQKNAVFTIFIFINCNVLKL